MESGHVVCAIRVPWTSEQWALSALIYQRFATEPGFGSLRRQQQDLLEAATGRIGNSWKARIDNFTSVVAGRTWVGGPGSQEQVHEWLALLESDLPFVRAEASKALKPNDAGRELALLLGLEPPVASIGDPELVPLPMFSQATFELLEQLHESPTMEFYKANRDALAAVVETPFQAIFRAVVDRMDPSKLDALEHEKRLFSIFPKNDYGSGGVWEHYWGALYLPGLTRTTSPQLFMWINRSVFGIGFAVGQRTDPSTTRRLVQAMNKHASSLIAAIGTEVEGHPLLFGASPLSEDGERYGDSRFRETATAENWFSDAGNLPLRVNVQLDSAEVLRMSGPDVVHLVDATWERLYPLMTLIDDEAQNSADDTTRFTRFDGFPAFCKAVETDDALTECAVGPQRTFTFWNTSGEGFQISEPELMRGLRRWADINDEIAAALKGHRNKEGSPDYSVELWTYRQDPFRDVFRDLFPAEDHPVFRALGRSQTYAFVAFMRKYVGFLLGDSACGAESDRLLDAASVVEALKRRGPVTDYLPDPQGHDHVAESEIGTTAPIREPDYAWLVEHTFLPEDLLREMVDSIRARGQIILSGVPGNGKTHLARCLAQALTGDYSSDVDYRKRAWSLVQFHPSYGYEQFIEGVMPGVDDDGHVVFAPEDGVVLRLADTVQNAGPGRIHVLVVDELNRANLPRVLGELLYLLEYRDQVATLRFRQQFQLPQGLLFIGTMNTADRSIRSIDTALRRRFDIFELDPNSKVLAAWYSSGRGKSTVSVDKLVEAFDKLNGRLEVQTDSHHRIGHTFFMERLLDPATLHKIWERQVFPLIKEALFGVSDADLKKEYEVLFSPLWVTAGPGIATGRPAEGQSD